MLIITPRLAKRSNRIFDFGAAVFPYSVAQKRSFSASAAKMFLFESLQ